MNPIISFAIVLAVMVLIVSRKFSLNYAICAGITLIAIFFGHYGLSRDIIVVSLDAETWNFVFMFYLVYVMSGILTESGMLKSMLEALERVFKSMRLVTIAVPTLIGLVPTPSGAIISAPFVKEVGRKVGIKRERMHLINYWFRHLTEFINPLYPGPILVVAITGVTFSKLFIVNIPVMILVVIVGFFFFVLPVKSNSDSQKARRNDLKDILIVVGPLVLAISLPIVFGLNLSISLLLTIILFLGLKKGAIERIRVILSKSFKPELLLLVFLVLLFKEVLISSSAVVEISEALIRTGMPIVLMLIIIPMIVGFLTGMAMGPVSITFPILLPLMSNTQVNLGYIMIAFVSAFMGVLLSPMHLCFSVTKEYFNVDYAKLYRGLIPAVTIVLSFTIALVLLGWPFF